MRLMQRVLELFPGDDNPETGKKETNESWFLNIHCQQPDYLAVAHKKF